MELASATKKPFPTPSRSTVHLRVHLTFVGCLRRHLCLQFSIIVSHESSLDDSGLSASATCPGAGASARVSHYQTLESNSWLFYRDESEYTHFALGNARSAPLECSSESVIALSSNCNSSPPAMRACRWKGANRYRLVYALTSKVKKDGVGGAWFPEGSGLPRLKEELAPEMLVNVHALK